ncbi:Retrovirus-related Pol polyprotein from transposon RE1 [Vitis vinifera]|uniref:Retrovirus-related Pol polyprotein from transposon RE1 n=1 Tax=Vitis vinifera TaxID=29760 RepID=A0A438KF95_VITVI|nr:Retrovirus-related Pol polyprotein from transposon RE1 [Vitis vinifera]
MHVNVKLAQEDGKLLDYTLQYRPIIGKLLYLTITRPDLCYAMNHLSQFLAKPRVPHLQVVVHVLQYIKNTIGQSPFYLASTSVQLKAFADADQGTCLVSRSSAEAKYRSMKNATCEIVLLLSLIKDLGVNHDGPTILFCANEAALHIAANQGENSKRNIED